MFKKKDPSYSDSVDTLIGSHTSFEGNIESEGTIRIDGKVKGDIRVSGNAVIGENAVISGSVYASNVHLSGTVEGNIFAGGMLRILSSAKLFGDIQVHSFVADEGALFQGKCSMLEAAGSEKSPEKTQVKKSSSSKDYKKSSVLTQLNDDGNTEAVNE